MVVDPQLTQALFVRTLPHKLVNMHLYNLYHHISFQANQENKLISDIKKLWCIIWKIFPELSNNSMKPATIPLISSSTTCTSTFFTTNHSNFPVTRTFTSCTHPHTIGYYYINATSSSNSTPKLSQTTLQTIPQPSRPPSSSPLLHPSHFPDNTIIKEKQSQNIYLHDHTEEILTNIGHFFFH